MNKIKCCHGCTERAVWKDDEKTMNCHSTCERYKAESEALHERNELIHKKKEKDNITNGYCCDVKSKIIKNHRKAEK